MAFTCGAAQIKKKQQDALQALVAKHISDPAALALAESATRTPTERGLQRWEQAHLVSALDTINAYQRDRKARAFNFAGGHGPSWQRSFNKDPRTRMCELLKSWFRANAGSSNLNEDEVRSICSLCRDLLNHPELFPARNPRSFLRSIADVYDHLQWQLQEVLEKDRSCADLAQRLLSLSRNLVSDVLAYVMLAPTDLYQTDSLPSLEVVSLWQSLPDEGHPLPERKDAALQKIMREAWGTRCGSLIASLLRMPSCIRLFAGADADKTAQGATRVLALPHGCQTAMCANLDEAKALFDSNRYKNSALAGSLRGSEKVTEREDLLEAILAISDLTYLLGEVMVQFHRVSDGLGDYGMIRVAPWLHPFLETVLEKVQRLKICLERLNCTLDAAHVLARARGQHVAKPAPSPRMCSRARQAIERALIGRSSHVNQLTQLIDDLRARSAPERLPHVAKGLGDAWFSLQGVLSSPEFRAHVGNAFPEVPALICHSEKVEFALPNDVTPCSPIRVQRLEAPSGPARKVQCIGSGFIEAEDNISTRSATPRSHPEDGCSQIQHPTESGGAQGLRVEVQRLRPSRIPGRAPKHHDQRSLELCDGRLLIFVKGSQSEVKFNIDLQREVKQVGLLSETTLQLSIATQRGVTEHKDYLFEFASEEAACSFCEELLRQGGQAPLC
eukprot:TRINITY_DN24077_c0_g1_i1.p1 TRINITY_DN24077_c0_g1~~TRINITY_DN24077_c0_g1_i1.p1  ORF type:complete len:673 (-),score=112.96 TRINITY_DN24077_c0_g1_i1:31-2049(-)